MDPTCILVAHEDALARRYLSRLVERLTQQQTCLEADCFDRLVEHLKVRRDVLVALVDLDLPGLCVEVGLRYLCAQFPSLRLALLFSSLTPEDAARLKDLRIAALFAKTTPDDVLLKTLQQIASAREGDRAWPVLAGDDDEQPPPLATGAYALTARQLEVMRLLSEGHSNRTIAQRLQLAEGTVKCHVNAGFRILGVHNRVSAARVFRERYLAQGSESN